MQKSKKKLQCKKEKANIISKPYMTQILELSDREFKTVMINMLKELKEKVGNMQEQTNKQRNRNSKQSQRRI